MHQSPFLPIFFHKVVFSLFIIMLHTQFATSYVKLLLPTRRWLSKIPASSESSSFASQVQSYQQFFPFLTSQQWDCLEKFCTLTNEWNEKVNLISRKDIDEIVPRHLLPSMSVACIRKFGSLERVIDVGCGGGFPGLPLAIMFPESNFTLLDSSTKKMMVVKDIVQKLKLENVRVVASRAEDCKEQFDSILGRAVSAIPNFLSFSSHLQDPKSNSGFWYLKGGNFSAELEDALIFDYSIYPVNNQLPLDSDKVILFIPAKEIISFRKRLKKMQYKKVRSPKY